MLKPAQITNSGSTPASAGSGTAGGSSGGLPFSPSNAANSAYYLVVADVWTRDQAVDRAPQSLGDATRYACVHLHSVHA